MDHRFTRLREESAGMTVGASGDKVRAGRVASSLPQSMGAAFASVVRSGPAGSSFVRAMELARGCRSTTVSVAIVLGYRRALGIGAAEAGVARARGLWRLNCATRSPRRRGLLRRREDDFANSSGLVGPQHSVFRVREIVLSFDTKHDGFRRSLA